MVMDFIRSTKFALSLVIVSALVLSILFFATNPQSARLFGVLVVVVALYGLFWGVILLISNLFTRKKRNQKNIKVLSQRGVSNSKVVEISAVLALAPVLVIVLNSLGSIGLIEIALIMTFECVVIFLIRKKK